MNREVLNILLLLQVPGIGSNRLRSLVLHFTDTDRILRATTKELSEVEGIERKTASSIVSFLRDSAAIRARHFADDQANRLAKAGGWAVTFRDKEYPDNLKKIYDPPPVLFVKGTLKDADRYSIAIVGTRTPSPYGLWMTERFTKELCNLGIPVISGLARGIDTKAHTTATNNGGRTLAVIGSGVDIIYPPENKALFERITRDGAVVSEFAMGTKPDATNFPRRNRIISGIAIGTLIVETGVNGGAMITASTALDQNRDTFAIPSPVHEKHQSGTNLLIKEGKALLTERIEDIINELAPRLKKFIQQEERLPTASPTPLTLFEQKLADALGEDPVHIDVLAERAGLSISDCLVHLLSLEFKGVVRQLRGKMFVKVD